MGAYIVTDSELVAIANAIRTKNSSSQVFTIDQIPAAIASIGENVGTGAVTRTANGNSYIINETKLTAIANAIRTKLGNNNQMTIAQMPNLIDSIEISQYKEISDSWDTIIANIDNGTYKTKYSIGDYKPLDLGTEGIINMQIVAMDADELADGSGYAPLTFIGMELLNTLRSYSYYHYPDSTTPPQGWNNCTLRNTLNNDVLALVPAAVRARINTVKKVHGLNNSTSTQTSYDKLWIPNLYEITGITTRENTPPSYSQIYKSDANRTKNRNGTATQYWMRTGRKEKNQFLFVTNDGAANAGNSQAFSNSSTAICLGFCLGLEQETITDDWATILANQNYATDYSIGDTKSLNLGTEGRQLMEIVAFDTDDRADGQGKAKITWISKGLLNTAIKWGNSYSDVWGDSNIRSVLRNTIYPLIPSTVKNAIVDVKKTSLSSNDNRDVETVDNVWIPSCQEVNNALNRYETGGYTYSVFSDNASRIKGNLWALRSTYWNGSSQFIAVYATGTCGASSKTSNTFKVPLCFCTN